MQSVLLIGGDARLSRYIDSRFASTILTTRRKNNCSSNRLFLDLNDTTCFVIPEGITSCVIVGGPISYEDSEKNYLTSLEVHSNQIPYLVESLFSRNIFTIYISSNMVFGEKSLNRNEYSLTSPDIKYGMLKDICEKALIHTADQLEKSNLLAIARLTKNVSCDTRPFDAWISNYINDEEIIAFDDLFFSPIDFSSSAGFIAEILDSKSSGIFHFSNEDDYSYFEFCQLFNKYLIDRNFRPMRLVRSNSIEKGVNLLFKGCTTKLNLSRTSEILKLNPLTLDDLFSSLLPYFVGPIPT